LKKRILAIVIPIALVLAIGGAVFASWNQGLTSAGTLQVGADQEYALSGTILNWGNISSPLNTAINKTCTLTVENQGSTPITGFNLSDIDLTSLPGGGTGWALALETVIADFPLTNTDGPTTLTFRLTGPALSSAQKIYLDSITCTLNPEVAP
jgi:hypothetical protein